MPTTAAIAFPSRLRRLARPVDAYVSAGRVAASGRFGPRSGSAVILGYHRVADATLDPHNLVVSPARFTDHMELLRERFRPMPLDELVRAARDRRLPPRAVGVTFDDGYADNLHAAGPTLHRLGIPATVFVATGGVEHGSSWWWNELEVLVLGSDQTPEQLTVRVKGRARTWPTATLEQRLRAHDDLRNWMRVGTTQIIDAIGAELRAWMPDMADRLTQLPRPMTVDEVRRLAAFGIAVGAHGHRHLGLRTQQSATVEHEVGHSRALLTEWLGRAPIGFSYPFGDAGRSAQRIVRRSGFGWAVGVRSGPATRFSDPYELPRVIVEDQDGRALERLLERLLRTSRSPGQRTPPAP